MKRCWPTFGSGSQRVRAPKVERPLLRGGRQESQLLRRRSYLSVAVDLHFLIVDVDLLAALALLGLFGREVDTLADFRHAEANLVRNFFVCHLALRSRQR